MFEKEAEEIVKRNVCGDCNKCQSYGYIGCDIYRYSKDSCLYGLRTGYNKANEWYKVADGDLPKENNLYLVAIKDNGLAIAYFNGLHWETKFNLGDFGHCLETVIAWCEIPKFEEK